MTSKYLKTREPQAPYLALLAKMRPDIWDATYGPIPGRNQEARRKACLLTINRRKHARS